MTTRNAYATLAEYKAYVTARGQTSAADATDDVVIDNLLEQASRFIDDETGRAFYPSIQARLYNVPDDYELCLDEDLLEVIAILTGGASLPSTEYFLKPVNYSPAYAICMNDTSIYTWFSTSTTFQNSISVNAIWGYHDRYSRDAWKVGTVLSEDLDLTETEFDVASSAQFSAGQIIRINNELTIVSSTASGKINVVSRGDNGSTAATHLSVTTVYIWQPMKSLSMTVMETAMYAYHRRFGKSQSNTETITAAGVMLSPRDIPSMAQAFIQNHKDMT